MKRLTAALVLAAHVATGASLARAVVANAFSPARSRT